jgi:alkylated DNA nucleotide flippase Atl1
MQDAELVNAVNAFVGKGKGGGIDWGQVSIQMRVARTPNQCHTRWESVLKHRGKTAQKKSRAWTEQDDIRLAEAVTMYDGVGRGGSVDWSKVASDLNSEHSSYQQRMRWHSVLKSRLHPATASAHCDHSKEKWTTEQVLFASSRTISSIVLNCA